MSILDRIDMIPESIGVYALMDHKRDPLYIGSAVSKHGIRKRVVQHLVQCNSSLITHRLLNPLRVAYVGYSLAKDAATALTLEKALINRATINGHRLANKVRLYPAVPQAPHNALECMEVYVRVRSEKELSDMKNFRRALLEQEVSDLKTHAAMLPDPGYLLERIEEKTLLLSRVA
jgi:excinuclease UvrABC nuclease subunit